MMTTQNILKKDVKSLYPDAFKGSKVFVLNQSYLVKDVFFSTNKKGSIGSLGAGVHVHLKVQDSNIPALNLPRDLIPSPQASSDEIEAGEVTPNQPSLNYRIAANNTIALIDKILLSDTLTDSERQNLQNRRAKLLKSLGAYGLEVFPETQFSHEEQPTAQDLEANAVVDNQIIEALKQPLHSEQLINDDVPEFEQSNDFNLRRFGAVQLKQPLKDIEANAVVDNQIIDALKQPFQNQFYDSIQDDYIDSVSQYIFQVWLDHSNQINVLIVGNSWIDFVAGIYDSEFQNKPLLIRKRVYELVLSWALEVDSSFLVRPVRILELSA